MKNNLFLIVLVFFITTIVLGNYVISAKLNIPDQNFMSKTKDNFGEYTSEVLLSTEEAKYAETLLNIDNSKVKTVGKIEEQEKETEKEVKVEAKKEQEIESAVEQTQTVPLSQETKEEVVNAEPKVEAPAQPKYGFLTTDGNVSNDNIRTAEREIARIPQNMLNAFASEGWRIEVSNENIAAKYFGGAYGNVMGVTITDIGVIVIQNRTSSIQSSIVHEFGHYIDTRFNYPSSSDEFMGIYYEEVATFKSRIPNSSCVRDEMEFFAHTFYYLLKDGSKCTPRAAEFVQRYMNAF